MIVMVQQIIIIISSYDNHTSNPFHKYLGPRYVQYKNEEIQIIRTLKKFTSCTIHTF